MKNIRKLSNNSWRAMKGILGAVIFSTVLMLFSFESFAAEGTVKPASAKIRESADTTSNVLASVESGDELTIKAKTTGTDGNVWYQVFVDANTLGFIRSDLLEAEGEVSQLAAASTQTEAVNEGAETPEQTPAQTPAQPDTNVESMPSQSATITGGDVNVRAGAGTSTAKVATAKNNTAVTVTGKATGSDSKVWYQVTFISDGKEVSGFIRSDYIELGEIIETQQPEEETPAETQAPEEPVQTSKDYETVLEDKEGGTTEWYLYDNTTGFKYSIPQIMKVIQADEAEESGQTKQLEQQKIIIIVLVVVLVILVLGMTLLVFKIRDAKYDTDDFDEDEEEEIPVRRRVDRRTEEGTSVRRSVPQEQRPVKRNAAPVSRPAQEANQAPRRRTPEDGAARPAQKTAGSRPVQRTAEGAAVKRTAPAGSRPVQRSAEAANRPVQRSAEAANRPVQRSAEAANRPVPGETGRRSAPKRPAEQPMPEREVSYEEVPETPIKQNPNGTWHSKNFLADDDEFEFEFLNMDDPNKL